MSLARAALREGGLANAIRTCARRGYRFCLESPSQAPARSDSPAGGPPAAREGTELELLAAGKAFQEAGAAFYLERCAALHRELASGRRVALRSPR